MRFLFDIGVIFFIFACAFFCLKLEVPDSIAVASISLAIILPSIANYWAVFRKTKGDSMSERWFSGLRGFGVLIWSMTFLMAMTSRILPIAVSLCLLVFGSLLWCGADAVEVWIRQRQHNKSSGADA